MPTYVYETIPDKKGARAKRYEIRQSMKDAPFTRHPETGEPIKRVILGGYGLMKKADGAQSSSSGGCGPSCGCH
jgi:predicted nucleic acid-binding Zn ribbon protein